GLARSTCAGLELMSQHGHHDRVAVLAVAIAVLAQAPFLDEAALAIAGDATAVVGVHAQGHAIEVQLLEGEAQGRPYRVGAVSPVPVRLVADHDAELGAVGEAADAMQAERPNV